MYVGVSSRSKVVLKVNVTWHVARGALSGRFSGNSDITLGHILTEAQGSSRRRARCRICQLSKTQPPNETSQGRRQLSSSAASSDPNGDRMGVLTRPALCTHSLAPRSVCRLASAELLQLIIIRTSRQLDRPARNCRAVSRSRGAGLF